MTEYLIHIDSRSFLALVALLFVVGVGCDRGGSSKRDAQYERLQGTWEVLDVRQGRISYGEQDGELTFRDENGNRTYRLRYIDSGDTTTVEGPAEMVAGNTIRFAGGFSYPLIWTFTFDEPDDLSDTVQFTLESSRDGRAQEVMSVFGINGTSQRVEMDLEYQ